MGYLLYNRRSYITAKALATQLGLKRVKSAKKLMEIGESPVIRYGNSKGKFRNDTRFNSPVAIQRCADSLRFSKWATDNNILTPQYTRFNPSDIPFYPFLLRKRWHRAGQDIIVIRNEEDLVNATLKLGEDIEDRYTVPFYETDYEIRLHYVLGDVSRIFVKESTDNVKSDIIRTSPNGWHYSIRNNLDNKYQKAQSLAHKVAEKLELAFGGIDMAWSSELGRYIIWEINTAPGLNKNTLAIYSNRLRQYV